MVSLENVRRYLSSLDMVVTPTNVLILKLEVKGHILDIVCENGQDVPMD